MGAIVQKILQILHDLSLTKNGDPWTCFGGYPKPNP